jgi:hypothetical protein
MSANAKGWLAIVGLAVSAAACGTAIPTATSPSDMNDSDGVAVTESRGLVGRVERGDCPGQLTMRWLSSGKGWVKMEAAWVDAKGQTTFCAVPTFSITPDADLSNPRFNPYQVTVSGASGLYALTATVHGKPLTVKLFIE